MSALTLMGEAPYFGKRRARKGKAAARRRDATPRRGIDLSQRGPA